MTDFVYILTDIHPIWKSASCDLHHKSAARQVTASSRAADVACPLVSAAGQTNDHVRLALPAEAGAIAEIQRRVWAAPGGGPAGQSLLDHLDIVAMTDAWTRAVRAPPAARYRVLVALVDTRPVGFAVTRPADDPDAEVAADGAIEELAIDPVARRRGHGSRLLNACADTLRADGFTHASCWVSTQDDDLRRFLAAAGWAPDGASREIGTEDDSVRLKQIRLHVSLAESPDLRSAT